MACCPLLRGPLTLKCRPLSSPKAEHCKTCVNQRKNAAFRQKFGFLWHPFKQYQAQWGIEVVGLRQWSRGGVAIKRRRHPPESLWHTTMYCTVQRDINSQPGLVRRPHKLYRASAQRRQAPSRLAPRSRLDRSLSPHVTHVCTNLLTLTFERQEPPLLLVALTSVLNPSYSEPVPDTSPCDTYDESDESPPESTSEVASTWSLSAMGLHAQHVPLCYPPPLGHWEEIIRVPLPALSSQLSSPIIALAIQVSVPVGQ